jgi:hypothetical protein
MYAITLRHESLRQAGTRQRVARRSAPVCALAEGVLSFAPAMDDMPSDLGWLQGIPESIRLVDARGRDRQVSEGKPRFVIDAGIESGGRIS